MVRMEGFNLMNSGNLSCKNSTAFLFLNRNDFIRYEHFHLRKKSGLSVDVVVAGRQNVTSGVHCLYSSR